MFLRKRLLFYCILPHLYGILSYYVAKILKNLFSGDGTPWFTPSGGLTLCVILISSSCNKMRTFAKNLRSLSSKTWTGLSKKHFQGVVPPDIPPSGPFRGSDPMCEFNIFKLHKNEDLCKKLEDPILKNMDKILKKPFFRGWYPLIYPFQGVWPYVWV